MSGSGPQPARRFQFGLLHLFLLTTGAAVLCGLIAWLGWDSVLLVAIASGPAVTLIVLSVNEGEKPLRAIQIGAGASAVSHASLSVAVLVIVSVNASPNRISVATLLVAPVLLALFGGVLGGLISLPFVGLWYAVRNTWRSLSERQAKPAPSRLNPRP